MNKKLKIFLISLAVIIIGAGGFLGVYRLQRIQGKATSEEINASIKNRSKTNKVVVYTQDRAFKNSVLEEVKEQIKDENIYLKIEPIEKINKNNPSDWDKVIILSTVQSSDPPKEALDYINKYEEKVNIGIFLTADSRVWSKQPDNIEATTGASKKENISIFSEGILAFIADK